MIPAITIHLTISLVNRENIASEVAPLILRIPISFVLRTVVYKCIATNPSMAINIESEDASVITLEVVANVSNFWV